jgi:uncharacterized protein YciI
MPYFVVFATDRPGFEQIRATHRPAHRERLRRHDHPVTVRIGGPTLDAIEGNMNGTMLVIEAETEDAVRAYLAEDPYMLVGLYERLEIRPFNWGLGQPEID